MNIDLFFKKRLKFIESNDFNKEVLDSLYKTMPKKLLGQFKHIIPKLINISKQILIREYKDFIIPNVKTL